MFIYFLSLDEQLSHSGFPNLFKLKNLFRCHFLQEQIWFVSRQRVRFWGKGNHIVVKWLKCPLWLKLKDNNNCCDYRNIARVQGS
jgi:hypothetical protein